MPQVYTSKFSPNQLPTEALEALFVGRERYISDFLGNLEEASKSESRFYILIFGPRGSGKTHLISLFHRRLTQSEALASLRKKFIISRFNEEEWGIASYFDFLVRVIETMEPYSHPIDRSEFLAALKNANFNSRERIPAAEDFILECIGDKQLLLVCENLDDLFQAIEEIGQKRFRAFIQNSNKWNIVSTTSSLSELFTGDEYPFFGFFSQIDLEALDFKTALLLLANKARFAGNAELAEFLDTPLGRARARAIHHLAGGNHRAYVVLFEFLTKQSLDDVYIPFMRMVDDLTPYYQDRIRVLQPLQRKIIGILSKHSSPIAVKLIASECVTTEQSVSKQLFLLSQAGYVKRNRSGRNSLYELREPLMRLCFEVKDNRTKHIRLFIDFLRHWFSPFELAEQASIFRDKALNGRDIHRDYIAAASKVLEPVEQHPFYNALSAEIRECFKSKDFDGAIAAANRLVAERGKPEDYVALFRALFLKKDSKAALKFYENNQKHFELNDEVLYYVAHLYLQSEKPDIARRIATEIQARQPEKAVIYCLLAQTSFALKDYQAAIREEQETLKRDNSHHHSFFVIGNSYHELGKLEEAASTLKQGIELDPNFYQFYRSLAEVFLDMNRMDDALVAQQKAVEKSKNSSNQLQFFSRLLSKAGRYKEASLWAEKALSRAQNDYDKDASRLALAYIAYNVKDWKAVIRYSEKINKSRRLAAAYSLIIRAYAYEKLGDTEKANKSLYEIEKLEGNGLERYQLAAASALEANKKYDEAFNLYLKAANGNPSNTVIVKNIIFVSIKRRDIVEAKKWLDRLEAMHVEDVSALKFLVFSFDSENTAAEDTVNYLSSGNSWNDGCTSLLANVLVSEAGGDPNYFPEAFAYMWLKLPQFAQGIASALVASYVRELLDSSEKFTDVRWASAINSLRGFIAEDTALKLAVQLLDIAWRYWGKGETDAILELPLEQRDLLTKRGAE